MIWSLLRIMIFLAALVALAFGLTLLAQADTALRLSFAGWELTLHPLQIAIVGLVVLGVVWGLLKLIGLILAVLRFLNGDETAISRYLDRNREQRGFQALADGMLALAAGEGRLALIKAQRAQSYLDRPELTNLLIAQRSYQANLSVMDRMRDAYKAALSIGVK